MVTHNREEFLRFTIKRLLHSIPQFDKRFVEAVEYLLPYASYSYLENVYEKVKSLEKINREFLNTLNEDDIQAILHIDNSSAHE